MSLLLLGRHARSVDEPLVASAVLRLSADPRLAVRPAELTGLGFTEAQRAFRTAWLGSRARP